MIYFDKENVNILKYIKRHKGVSEGILANKFGADVSMFLILLVQERYLIAEDENKKYVIHDTMPYHSSSNFKYYPTPKLNQLVEEKVFNFWKWTIPTFISILSLILSIITLLFSIYGNDIIKVLLIE